MSYYKIMRNGIVVDANNVFLRWQSRRNTLMVCEPGRGQFICSSDGASVYRVPWLLPAPEGVEERFPVVEAVEIGRAEYEELRDALASGEQPEAIEEPTQNMEESIQTEDEAERPMTRAQLTEKLHKLEADNEFLMGCLMEMSEIVYG